MQGWLQCSIHHSGVLKQSRISRHWGDASLCLGTDLSDTLAHLVKLEIWPCLERSTGMTHIASGNKDCWIGEVSLLVLVKELSMSLIDCISTTII